MLFLLGLFPRLFPRFFPRVLGEGYSPGYFQCLCPGKLPLQNATSADVMLYLPGLKSHTQLYSRVLNMSFCTHLKGRPFFHSHLYIWSSTVHHENELQIITKDNDMYCSF